MVNHKLSCPSKLSNPAASQMPFRVLCTWDNSSNALMNLDYSLRANYPLRCTSGIVYFGILLGIHRFTIPPSPDDRDKLRPASSGLVLNIFHNPAPLRVRISLPTASKMPFRVLSAWDNSTNASNIA